MKKFNRYVVEIQFEGRKLTEYVSKETFIVGRSSDCEIHIDSKNLSRKHLKVTLLLDQIYVEDLNSTNGCFLGGEALVPSEATKYDFDKVLTLGKHDDVVLTIKAKFESEKDSKPVAMAIPTAKEAKENLAEVFNKDNQSLHDPAPKKAERDYKEIMNQVEILKTEIISRAEKRADKILEEAKVEAEKILAESNGKSEEIIAQSKVSAEKLIADAVEQSKNIKEQTELADLLKEIENKKAEVERVNEIIATCRENLKSLELKNAEFIELESKNTELEIKNKSLESHNNFLLENKTDIEGQIALISKQLENSQSEAGLAKASFEEFEAKTSNLRSEASQLDSEVQKLKDLKSMLADDVEELNAKSTELIELRNSYAQIQSDLAEKNEDFKTILLEIQNLNTDLKALKDTQLDLQSEHTKQKLLIDEEKENISKLHKEYEEFVERNKGLKAEIDEITGKRDNSLHELSQLNDKVTALEKECGQMLKKAGDESDLIISQAKAKAQSEYISLIQKSKQDIVEKEELLLAHARSEAKTIVEKAHEDAKKIEADLKNIQADLTQKAEVKAEKIIKESQERADELRDKAQANFQKAIKDAEIEADKIKVHSIQLMDEKKKDFVELEKKRIRKSSELLKSELNVLLYSKLKLYLKEDSDEYTARVKSSLEAAVNSSMLNEVLDNDDEMYALLDDQTLKQQQKSKNYWRFTVPGVCMSLIAVYFAVPHFKEAIKDQSRKVASVSKKETQERIKKMDDEAKKELFEFFSPKKTSEFKSTYTDRVLYTENFAELSLQKEYREDWILELQTFFVDDLELSENALVPFISQEANMIKELVDQSKRINGKFIEQGIAKMREIEDEFVTKLKSNLRSDKDYKKIMDFQKKHFKKKVKQL